MWGGLAAEARVGQDVEGASGLPPPSWGWTLGPGLGRAWEVRGGVSWAVAEEWPGGAGGPWGLGSAGLQSPV